MGKPSGHNDRRETLLDVHMWNFDGQCPLSIVTSSPELEYLILNVLFLVKKKNLSPLFPSDSGTGTSCIQGVQNFAQVSLLLSFNRYIYELGLTL